MKMNFRHFRIWIVATGLVLLTAIVLKPRAQRDYKRMELEQKEHFKHSPYHYTLQVFKLF
tara:strand:+ start:116 stop:295 length:180 start_codon:yes stop_codon:yes gene_type:complete